jgi:hypothetical protein
MRTKRYRTHYLSYEEQDVLDKFEKGSCVTDEIKTIISRPHDDKSIERIVPPMREKKKITFD